MSLSKQAGFSMIEILVSVLVLAIGLLGVASMQTLSVKSSANSNLKSIALYLANDMADRVRANTAGAQTGEYDNLTGGVENSCTSKCSSKQIAESDKYEWQQFVQNSLPQGEGEITQENGIYTITLEWTERVKQGEIEKEDGEGNKVLEDAGIETATFEFSFQL